MNVSTHAVGGGNAPTSQSVTVCIFNRRCFQEQMGRLPRKDWTIWDSDAQSTTSRGLALQSEFLLWYQIGIGGRTGQSSLCFLPAQ